MVNGIIGIYFDYFFVGGFGVGGGVVVVVVIVVFGIYV